MANLGSIGKIANKALQNADFCQCGRINFRVAHCGDQRMTLGTRDANEGVLAPSLRIAARGVKKFWWKVAAGSRTIAIQVKQAANQSPRPRLVVKANPDIGVNADVTGTAASSSDWVTIGPLSVTPSSDGALQVILEARYDAQVGGAPCFWDNLVRT